ncbi:YARHG domain-containing protein [Pedobacter metabolipauper]|uniref:YARHG domain-containing protein n=1 Tax=Pedobacter metabolipauper TaxID=425513 RepID=A0A4R6SYC9_9SPHI|nr:YARHG domain-containing protein [Pedobacter metabolipauper]TDQ11416.1 YARHG domain-containing protein [Pedobacter metabolipauper]
MKMNMQSRNLPLNVFLLILFSFSVLIGCGDGMVKNKVPAENKSLSEQPDSLAGAEPVSLTSSLIIQDEKDLKGYWVGMFEPDTSIDGVYTGEVRAWDYSNKINISIDEINGSNVKGHSVVAGNDRPFTGTFEKAGAAFNFFVKEPGDDKYDGQFSFRIDKGDSTLTGIWIAYGKIRIPQRKYELVKKNFRYDPNVKLEAGRYIDWKKSKKVTDEIDGEPVYDNSYFTTTDEVNKYNASADLLTKDQVANMKKADLFIIRNTIYARHGYSYKDQQLRAYFDMQPWYIPVSTNVKSQFTDLEKKNIALLLRYEKNAKEYYDVFGRG